MGELIDQDEVGPSLDGRVEVEILDTHALGLELALPEELQADEQRAGVVAAVSLDDANRHIALLIGDLEASRLEHCVRLPDAGRGPEEYGELSSRGLRLLAARAHGSSFSSRPSGA